MARGAEPGNQRALGNKGNRSCRDNRAKAVKAKGYLLDYIIKVFESPDDNESLKKELVLRLGANAFPKELEGQGDEGEFIVKVINYAGNNNSISIPATRLSIAIPSDSQKVQGADMAQEIGQDENGS